jgi:unsaturated chondroitin disaccharide hydrolase
VDYSLETGEVLEKGTFQGYSDESTWARGQAWALYGYTMMFRETGDSTYLQQAIHIADYIIQRLPSDFVPYWDFDDPGIPDEPKDASAAAITASALLELYPFAGRREPYIYLWLKKCWKHSCLLEYTAQLGTNGNFILKQSVGTKIQIQV